MYAGAEAHLVDAILILLDLLRYSLDAAEQHKAAKDAGRTVGDDMGTASHRGVV
jgi:hypothetical protein